VIAKAALATARTRNNGSEWVREGGKTGKGKAFLKLHGGFLKLQGGLLKFSGGSFYFIRITLAQIRHCSFARLHICASERKTGKQALVAGMNKLLKQVFAVVKNNSLYQPNYCSAKP
jgi:hypothetical protein